MNIQLPVEVWRLIFTNLDSITNESLKYLTNLTFLDKSRPRRSNISLKDEAISQLFNLTYLNMKYNDVISDRGIENLTNLETLYVGSMVSNIGIKLLTKLTTLYIMENRHINHNGIQHLTSLTYLDLSSNQIITNETIWGLNNLKSLILIRNFYDY